MKKILAIVLSVIAGTASAQRSGVSDSVRPIPLSEMKYRLSEDGSRYVKLTFLNQVWMRWNHSNPGTTVNGEPQDHTFDIGLRRTRLQLYGQISDHVFFYMQYGLNNFNFLAQNAGNRKLHAFFHDALGEYKVFKRNDALKIGAGLTITNGLSRFTQPSIGTIMTTDVPVFLQATVDQTDEFARRLAVYARGQVSRLDYRVAISDPFPIQTSGSTPPLTSSANFTPVGHTKQYAAMLIWNFFDREPHTTPYMTGTYLGERKVVNLEAGAIYQNRATWSTTNTDTSFHDMLLWSVAAFADLPLAANRYALSAYLGYFNTDYGPGYIRNNGIMNPANGVEPGTVASGPGNSYPMFGTGSSIYAQAGLRLPEDLLGDKGTLLPYISYRYSDYDRLMNPVHITNVGVNWLIDKHRSKLSFNYELRPVYEAVHNVPDWAKLTNRGSAWLQYQVSF